jgi:hypothetical protein
MYDTVTADKRSFLTRNGLLLQRDMQKEVRDLKKEMRLELQLERERQRRDLMALKVSSRKETLKSTLLYIHPPPRWSHVLRLLSLAFWYQELELFCV